MLSPFSPTYALKSAPNALPRHHYEDTQDQAFSISSPCNCNRSMARILTEVEDQSAIEFETVLRVGLDVTKQCEAMVSCEYCRTHRHTIISLKSVLERILIFYEAACSTYGLGPVHAQNTESSVAFGQSSPILSLLQNAQPAVTVAGTATSSDSLGDGKSVVCRTSKITWGDVELQGEDARLLAKVLLRQRLTSLGALLREILRDVWNRNWAQQAEALRACEMSLTSSMDNLMTLLGRLR